MAGWQAMLRYEPAGLLRLRPQQFLPPPPAHLPPFCASAGCPLHHIQLILPDADSLTNHAYMHASPRRQPPLPVCTGTPRNKQYLNDADMLQGTHPEPPSSLNSRLSPSSPAPRPLHRTFACARGCQAAAALRADTYNRQGQSRVKWHVNDVTLRPIGALLLCLRAHAPCGRAAAST